jgi:hypothetical protein
MHDRILVLRMCQVQDPNRGSFFVKVQPDGRSTHLGKQVYKDVYGVRFIIEDAEGDDA